MLSEIASYFIAVGYLLNNPMGRPLQSIHQISWSSDSYYLLMYYRALLYIIIVAIIITIANSYFPPKTGHVSQTKTSFKKITGRLEEWGGESSTVWSWCSLLRLQEFAAAIQLAYLTSESSHHCWRVEGSWWTVSSACSSPHLLSKTRLFLLVWLQRVLQNK